MNLLTNHIILKFVYKIIVNITKKKYKTINK